MSFYFPAVSSVHRRFARRHARRHDPSKHQGMRVEGASHELYVWPINLSTCLSFAFLSATTPPLVTCGVFLSYLFVRSLVVMIPLLLFHFTEPYGPFVPQLHAVFNSHFTASL